MKKYLLTAIFLSIFVNLYSQLPYTESFETDFGIWNQLSAPLDEMDWIRNSGPTPTSGTGPNSASDGIYYAYIEATDNYNPPKSAILEATFDFSNDTLPILSFDYHMYGYDIGNLYVVVLQGSDSVEVWNAFNDHGNQWNHAFVSLEDFAGKSNVRIRFKAETAFSDSSDIAIDNIEIRDFKITDTSHVDVTCGSYADGSITISVNGGFPGYYYSINGDIDTEYVYDSSPTHTFTGLSGKDYTVFVKDTSGATLFGGIITVFEPATTQISTSHSNVDPCIYSHNGQIVIEATGDGAPFTYSIDSPGGPFVSNDTFPGLDTGLYNIYVKNSYGCIATGDPVKIECPYMINILETNTTDVSTCHGDCNGTISITSSGGYTPLKYALDTSATPIFQTSSDFTGICAGTYSVIIKDNAGCLDTTTNLTITEPTSIQINSTNHTNVTGCYGDNNATISISASGGTGIIEYSIDNGFSFQTSGYFDSLYAGTYNILVRDQNNCSAIGDTITISQPSLLVLDSTPSQNVTGCFGNSNGEITIYAHGGTSPISYSIDNGNNYSTSNNFTNLNIGTYYPYIKDANACVDSADSVSIIQPPELKIDNVNYYDVTTCYGYNTGKIQIYASQGTEPFSYSIDGGLTFQSSFIFDSLPAGDYNIVVRDDNLCEKNWDSTITITQPDSITITSTSKSDVICNGSNDGTITVSAIGGTGDLYYSIDNGISFPYNNDSTIYVGSGSYRIAIRDENNCKIFGDTLHIYEPDTLLIDSVLSTNVQSCYDSAEGTITIFVSGGTEPYQYSIDNGQSFQDSNFFDNVHAGTGYWPFVKDSHNCTRLGSQVTITQPSQITIYSQDHTDVDTCHGEPIGTITINASGGTGTLYYSIDNGNTYFDNGGFFENLYAGTYYTRVKDQNNCEIIGWEETIIEPDTLVIDSVLSYDIRCFGYGDGKIFITATGGQPQLKYSIDNGLSFQVSNQFTSVLPGHYDIIVKDNYNCRVHSSTDIYEPTQLILDTVYYTNVNTCYGDNSGEIEVIASGGTAPIQYSYCPVNQSPSVYQDSNIFYNVPAGSYYVTIMDDNACFETSNSFVVTEPTAVQISNIHKTDISCYGMNDGSITINATGGNGVYEYSIDNGVNWADTNVFSNLSEGTYLVNVRDTNGCLASYAQPISIIEPTQLSIFSVNATSPSCYDGTDGKIIVNVNGGTLPYSYILNDTIIQSSNTFSNLDSGYYWITIIDGHNCVAQSDTVYLSKPLNYANFSASDTLGCSPLSVTFTPDSTYGGYHWYFSDSTESSSQEPTHIFENTSNNTRTFKITCYSYHSTCVDTSSRYIEVIQQPNPDFTIDTSIHYYPDTTIDITNTATQYSNYYWDFGDGDTFTGIQPIDHSYSSCGNFDISLSAENSFGCIDTVIKTVFITAISPQAEYLIDKSAGCKPLQVEFTNISSNSIDYKWVLDNNTFSTDTNTTYEFTEDGNYLVYLYAYGNCGLKDSTARFVQVYPTPDVNFDVAPDTQSINNPVQFTNYSTGATYYIWDFGDSTLSSNTDETHYYSHSGSYTVKLKAYSPNQCYGELVKENAVYILDSLYFTFPTAFSPDGDGINDYLIPFYYGVKNCTVEIYDRRGHLIFKTNKYDTDLWDGTIDGNPLPIDVYIWRASGRYITGETLLESGSITLIR